MTASAPRKEGLSPSQKMINQRWFDRMEESKKFNEEDFNLLKEITEEVCASYQIKLETKPAGLAYDQFMKDLSDLWYNALEILPTLKEKDPGPEELKDSLKLALQLEAWGQQVSDASEAKDLHEANPGIYRALRQGTLTVDELDNFTEWCEDQDINHYLKGDITKPEKATKPGTYILPADIPLAGEGSAQGLAFCIDRVLNNNVQGKVQLLIPLNDGIEHWRLGIINLKDGKLTSATLWDPMSFNEKNEAHASAIYENFRINVQTAAVDVDLPIELQYADQQQDGWSCGDRVARKAKQLKELEKGDNKDLVWQALLEPNPKLSSEKIRTYFIMLLIKHDPELQKINPEIAELVDQAYENGLDELDDEVDLEQYFSPSPEADLNVSREIQALADHYVDHLRSQLVAHFAESPDERNPKSQKDFIVQASAYFYELVLPRLKESLRGLSSTESKEEKPEAVSFAREDIPLILSEHHEELPYWLESLLDKIQQLAGSNYKLAAAAEKPTQSSFNFHSDVVLAERLINMAQKEQAAKDSDSDEDVRRTPSPRQDSR